MAKGFTGRAVSVIICPSLYFGIQQRYQTVGRCLLMSFNRFSDILQERLHVLFRRASEQEPVILPDILSKKVETVRDVRDLGFLLREFQASFLEESSHEGFDFL